MPLFKKGDPTNIDNYRGTSLLSLPGKVFAIVHKRLGTWTAAKRRVGAAAGG